MHFTKLPAAIIDGKLDSILEPLNDAVRTRQRVLREQEAARMRVELKPDDRVVFHSIRPKYMVGLRATVLATPPRRAGDIMVRIDEMDYHFVQGKQRGNRRFSREVGVPASCLKPEEAR